MEKAYTLTHLVRQTRRAQFHRRREKIKSNNKRTEQKSTHRERERNKHKTISTLSIQYTRFEFKLGTLKIHTITCTKKSAEYENKSITASQQIEQRQRRQAFERAATAINSNENQPYEIDGVSKWTLNTHTISSTTRFELIRIEIANQFHNMFVALLDWTDSTWNNIQLDSFVGQNWNWGIFYTHFGAQSNLVALA